MVLPVCDNPTGDPFKGIVVNPGEELRAYGFGPGDAWVRIDDVENPVHLQFTTGNPLGRALANEPGWFAGLARRRFSSLFVGRRPILTDLEVRPTDYAGALRRF